MEFKDHFRKFINITFIILFSVFLFSSCSTVHVYQAGSNGGLVEGNQPGTEWESKRVNTFLWGAVRQDVVIDDCRLGDGTRLNIEEIKIDKNFGSILATVLTIGLWEPSKISWKCAKPRIPTR